MRMNELPMVDVLRLRALTVIAYGFASATAAKAFATFRIFL